MDPSFYYQPPQNQNLMPKMSKMNPPMQNIKPGYTYQEAPLYNYSQANNQIDPQMDLYRAAQVYNYPEQHNQVNQYQPTVKLHKNPKTGNLITEVWRQNLEEEFNRIMDLIEEFPLIALDTEFPGIPYGYNSENEYLKIKENVDKLKVIQIGFSLAKEDSLATNIFYTWQFNFKFDQYKDECTPESIRFLNNAGINFTKLDNDGIDPLKFAEILIASGLILNEDLKWVSFHGGFDFGYLLKLLICCEMPPTIKAFYAKLKLYFPDFIDIKYIVKTVDELKAGGLSRLAAELCVDRIGEEHQAGSDALLTLAVFLKLKEKYPQLINDTQTQNIIYMLEGDDDEMRDYYQDYYYMHEYPNHFYNSYNLNNIGNIMNNFYQNQSDPYNMQGIYTNYNDVLYKGFQYQNDNAANVQNLNQKQKKFK